MAINCDPSLYAYAGPLMQCAFFPPGTTPVTIFASFIGIEPGQAWLPGDLPPPNGIFQLTQIAQCSWQLLTPALNCIFVLSGPASMTFFDPNPPNPSFFLSGAQIGGTFSFTSIIIDVPPNKYFGGTCILQSPLDDDIRSLQTVLQALNIDPAQPTYDNPRALDPTFTWHTIGNEDDTTVVKIKFDHT